MPNSTSTANNDLKPKNWVLGGTYDLKVVKLHAAYGQNIDGIISGGSGAVGGLSVKSITSDFGAVGIASGVASGRTNQWMAGLSAPVGAAGKVLFSVSQMAPGGNFKSAATDTMTNAGIVYTYSLSKRTSLYGSYSYASNYGMVDGLDVNAVGAGIVHLF
jgi:predicted porin